MKTLIATAFMAAILLTGGTASGAQVSVGIRIGAPPAPRVLRVMPPRPTVQHVWIAGYWYPNGRSYKWHAGYWTQPPYQGARWIEPHHDGQMYFAGYWEGDHGQVAHDHKSDRGRDRDYRR
jgi:hypothetical protein